MKYQILKTIVDAELRRFENISEEEWYTKHLRRNGQEKKL